MAILLAITLALIEAPTIHTAPSYPACGAGFFLARVLVNLVQRRAGLVSGCLQIICHCSRAVPASHSFLAGPFPRLQLLYLGLQGLHVGAARKSKVKGHENLYQRMLDDHKSTLCLPLLSRYTILKPSDWQ